MPTNRDAGHLHNHSIDFDFIGTFEGGSLLDGYVPDARKSKSGVTIGVGFDLGARNVNDLKVLELPLTLINKLSDYLGLQGTKAQKYLQRNPLKITEEEASTINLAVKSRLIMALISKFEADANVAFSSIRPQWQTVIASVEFQYGSVQRKCPSFWRCVTKQDWNKAISELRNFGDRYPTRRNKEADYAEQLG